MTLSTSTAGETETSEGETTETTAGPSGSETDTSTQGETESETDSDTESMTTEEPIIPFEIMPEELTVVVYNNISEQGDYNALYDGESVEPTWALSNGTLAVIDDEGKVLGTGSLGGQTNVQASYEGQLDEALLNIVLEKNVDIGPIEPIDKDLLEGATEPDEQITWAYPYDRMVYPLGLRAPELMWNGGGAGDKYLIHLTGDFIDFKY
ncbi:MAG: hypothetical protein ACPG4T_02360, partial [Nannocystaceae bacterium]